MGLEFCSLGIQMWDSVFEFGLSCLGFLILEFENSCYELCLGIWYLIFGILEFGILSLGFKVWDLHFRCLGF